MRVRRAYFCQERRQRTNSVTERSVVRIGGGFAILEPGASVDGAAWPGVTADPADDGVDWPGADNAANRDVGAFPVKDARAVAI